LESINLISVATIAFLGSFGHCAGMCGGIVIAYTSTKLNSKYSKIMQSLAHITYSSGRITTYTILGMIFGYIGGVATFNNSTNAIFLFIAGIAMLLAGLSLLGKITFLIKIEHSLSNQKWYQDIFRSQLNKQNFSSFYILGLLNGLLPCGFVYFFAITAASTADMFWGAVVMLIFGLSTVPVLFSIGFFVGIFKNNSFKDTFIKLAGLGIILYAFLTISSGYEYFTTPTKTLNQCHN